MAVSEEIIKQIVEELDSNFKLFIHIKTHEIVRFPDEDMGHEIDEAWQDEVDKVENDKDAFIEIEAPDSREGYKMMQDFIFTIEDKSIADKLTQAINGRKPFANFKQQIDETESERLQWFEFRDQQLAEYVKQQLRINEI